MIIKKYGIALKRLTEQDIELVRTKRNDKAIREKMFYQKIISPEEQLKWFKSINNSLNYYFIIEYNNKKIGLTHGKIVSYTNAISEGGLFIWDKKYQNTHIPVLASVCMTDLTFYVLKMKKAMAKVRFDNDTALTYNEKLGYKEVARANNEVLIELDLLSYESSEIKKLVKKITNDSKDISWENIYLNKNELKLPLYKDLPLYLQQEFDKMRQ